MRTLFVGDVHGCAEELKELLAIARPNRTIFIGDLFTKGPQPRVVWEIIQQTNALAVLGNHDAFVLQQQPPNRNSGQ